MSVQITVTNPSGPINLTEADAKLLASDLKRQIDYYGSSKPYAIDVIVTVEAEVAKTVSVTVPEVGTKTGRYACGPYQALVGDGITCYYSEGLVADHQKRAGWWREFREGIESGNPRTYRIEYALPYGRDGQVLGWVPSRIHETCVYGRDYMGFQMNLPADRIRSITRLPR